MISIEQLLESVDLDFEPRFVTKSNNDRIDIFDAKPESTRSGIWWTNDIKRNFACIGYLKIAEFDGKPWNECIYEVPRKTTGKVEKVEGYTTDKILAKVNEIIDWINKVDSVNELKGANNE